MREAAAHVNGPLVEQAPNGFASAGDLFGRDGRPSLGLGGDARELAQRVQCKTLNGEHVVACPAQHGDFITGGDSLPVAGKPRHADGGSPNLEDVIHHGATHDQPVLPCVNRGFNGRA